MSNLGRTITWVGAAYGAVASAYLLVWYASALHSRGQSPFDLLENGAPVTLLLAIHFFVGLLSVLKYPKLWIPLGPPSEYFKLAMTGIAGVGLCNFLLYVPALARFGISGPVHLALPSLFLAQTLYILAHYTTGYTLFSERRNSEERLRIVLEGIKTGDVAGVCEAHGIPQEIYRRWELEIEQSSMGFAISKLKLAKPPDKRNGHSN